MTYSTNLFNLGKYSTVKIIFSTPTELKRISRILITRGYHEIKPTSPQPNTLAIRSIQTPPRPPANLIPPRKNRSPTQPHKLSIIPPDLSLTPSHTRHCISPQLPPPQQQQRGSTGYPAGREVTPGHRDCPSFHLQKWKKPILCRAAAAAADMDRCTSSGGRIEIQYRDAGD